jgi:hypothetical protein
LFSNLSSQKRLLQGKKKMAKLKKKKKQRKDQGLAMICTILVPWHPG